jgi:hypothetical protein
MGLAVVHGIVRGHGGAISIESAENIGTRVDIFFPIVNRKAQSDTEKIKTISTGNECILFIDDEQSLSKITKSILSLCSR